MRYAPLRPNTAAIVRAAQTVIAQHTAAISGTAEVLWQKSYEGDEAFAKRINTARTRLIGSRLLVAVCGPAVVQSAPGVCVVEMPRKMLRLFDQAARYRACYGGRGAARSWTFARALVVRSMMARTRILCAREFQNSIADSIHTLLSDQIELLGLSAYFDVQNQTIVGRNGSEFIFAGIRSNVSRIKSLEGVNIAYIEEAAGVSANSWETLIPTIRAAGSEIWSAFNPDLDSDPTYQRFVINAPDNAIVLQTSFADNPWFPAELEAEKDYLRRVDRDAYQHVWEGGCRTHSDAQIFRGKYIVEAFEPGADWHGPYFGADWGFSQDPTTCVKAWIANRTLYVEYEAYGIGVDIDRTPQLFDSVPGARHATIRADSARPETISFMQRHGYSEMAAVQKWKGSVEDGIAHLRSYELIVIHPRCTHTGEEMRLYSFRVDRLSGDIFADPIDRNNHCIDALRYALTPMIKGGGPEALLEFYKQQLGDDAAPNSRASTHADRPGVVVTTLTSPWHK